jgi:hypothetical protein
MFGLSLPFAILTVNAAEVMPDFSGVPTGWTVDRYDPTSFTNVGTYQGRADVLGIEITSAGDSVNRGAQSGSFYNTQGRQYALSSGVGSVLSADLFIPSLWSDASLGSVRTDMWGIMMDNAAAVSAYPIIGFTNYGGAARLRVYDGDLLGGAGDWVDLGNAIAYDAWTSLSIELTASSFIYSVNGTTVYTDNTTGGSTSFDATIMQAYNFADPAIQGATPIDYTAHWSNKGQSVPDGGTTLVLLGCALTGLGALRRKFVA